MLTFNIKIDGTQVLPEECDEQFLEDMGFTISENENSIVSISGGVVMQKKSSYSYVLAELKDIEHWKSAKILPNGDILISFNN